VKIYDNIFPEEFHRSMKMDGKYAIENSNGDYYRFVYPEYEFAIDVENLLLGVGIEHQCDKLILSKREANINTIYTGFLDESYSCFIYFVNDNYTGGRLILENSTISPISNRGVYFDNTDKFELETVEEGTQYLIISYFRKNKVKRDKTLL